MSHLLPISVLTGILLVTPPATADAPPSKSAEPARELVRLLEGRATQTIAARVPNTPNRYVAAMKAGPMLLVVGAAYAQPALLNEQIWKGDFDGAYRTLNTASVRKGKIFVQDMAADGLHPGKLESGAYDTIFEAVTSRTAFDGDWKAQKLSQQAYERKFTAADAQYAELLQLLVAALKSPPTEPK